MFSPRFSCFRMSSSSELRDVQTPLPVQRMHFKAPHFNFLHQTQNRNKNGGKGQHKKHNSKKFEDSDSENGPKTPDSVFLGDEETMQDMSDLLC